MNTHTSGYAERDHTADWELHVWATDLAQLLRQAAAGMYALAQTQLAEGARHTVEFEISFSDHETLLVNFLSELLFFGETQHLAFEQYHLDFGAASLRVQARAAPILHQAKEIKAVTYHQMKVHETVRGLEVNIVFDV